MEKTRRKFSSWGEFDHCFKMVAAHTALDYLRSLNHQRKREVNLDDLSQKDLMRLTTVDRHPSDSSVFRFRGYELTIDNDDVAEAFSRLSAEAQSILILRFARDMTDREIGDLIGLPRYTVQRRRSSAIRRLRVELKGLMPEGGV